MLNSRNAFGLMLYGLAILLASTEPARAQRTISAEDLPRLLVDESLRPAGIPPEDWADAQDLELGEHWEKAGRSWLSIAAQNDGSYPFRLRAAACFLRAGDSSSAEAIPADPHPPAAETWSTLQTHLLGASAYLQRDERKAWRELMKLTKQESCETSVYHLLAKVSIGQDSLAEAVGWLRKVIDQEQEDSEQLDRWLADPLFDTLKSLYVYRDLLRQVEERQGRAKKTENLPIPPSWNVKLDIKQFEPTPNARMLMRENQ